MIERDEVTGASYYRLADLPVARSVHVSDLVVVDVDKADQPVGVEVAVDPKRLPAKELEELLRRFPRLAGRLPITKPTRPRDVNRLAASIVEAATQPMVSGSGGVRVSFEGSQVRLMDIRVQPDYVQFESIVPARNQS